MKRFNTTLLMERLEKKPIKYRTMIKLFLYTGIRRGELAGLEWGDIDLRRTQSRSSLITVHPEEGRMSFGV